MVTRYKSITPTANLSDQVAEAMSRLKSLNLVESRQGSGVINIFPGIDLPKKK